MDHRTKTKCPVCQKEHGLKFDFGYEPDDGDEETEYIDCECGCEFEVTCELEIDIDYHLHPPNVIKMPTKEADSQEPYVSNDPN